MDDSHLPCNQRRRLIGGIVSILGSGLVLGARAGEVARDHDHGHHHGAAQADAHDHSAHKAQLVGAGQVLAQQRMASYRAPPIAMVDQLGNRVAFDKALDDGRPVILNFIFTSCTTICPVLTQILVQVQDKLGDEKAKVHMVSVSIDPEYDTPARLLAYSRQNRTGEQWDFYTGSNDASVQVQKAFDAYRGGKMNHEAVVLLRGPRGTNWVRLDGFASADQIISTYRTLAG